MHQSACPLRILVVDDNVDAAELVAELLSMLGHCVAVANSGMEAMATAENFVPNLIFLDIGMPEIDGYRVASMLRQAAWFPLTRIVALTAWGDALSLARTKAHGFDSHLVKPAPLARLVDETELAMAG